MDFIFMLTRNDQTVTDCLDVCDLIRPLRLRHVGFKDIGVDFAALQALTAKIHAMGAQSYMEVVSTTAQDCLNSAKMAVALGVGHLLGGTEIDATLEIIRGTPIRYYPFPGAPEGHPTRLGGSAAQVEAQCRQFMQKGCAGADLLAYRATQDDPLRLVEAARRGLADGRLIIAGNIDSAARIAEVAARGADAFTIGSAVFNGAYAPDKGSTLSQLAAVIADCTHNI
ncbi:4-hydroxythreonine-4-phosphate dehydrogenase [Acidocella aquatica]|uniref:4-hydroxythreonine-4-phosphate dehydrogenase n=1 Tax=Acidocella aquatica TaxID=1922313 RepID=A0ABQ6AAZ7_9PROT|nr:hypothetical protein [Acidocella aquatica]GLR67762.1 4-hydroxythreonine-4-phosphate dehydrogenase [Acidocella aquatica]